MKDLAPDIIRQRMVVEGTLRPPASFGGEKMTRYCNDISPALKMTPVTAPVCSYDDDYGWCAYMHWKESGVHMYAWDKHDPPFFSVDIYTCKQFDPVDAINFTRRFFRTDLIDIVWKE